MQAVSISCLSWKFISLSIRRIREVIIDKVSEHQCEAEADETRQSHCDPLQILIQIQIHINTFHGIGRGELLQIALHILEGQYAS